MVKTSRLLGGFLVIATIAFLSSCSDDDKTNIGGGGSVPVADGFYVTKVGVTPVTSSQLVDEQVEADAFASQDRTGFLANYVYLTAGSYNVVSVIDQEIAKTLGGAAVVANNATVANPDGTGSDCDLHDYILVEEFSEGGAAIAIDTEGLYKVMMDNETKEILFYHIVKGQIIGSASPAGWSSSVDQDMEVSSSSTSTSAVFELNDITLRPGEYKLRFNCRWGIDRRIDPAADPGHEFNNGYVAYTNFGGTLTELKPGGTNFVLATDEDGIYDFKATWTPASGFTFTVTKTQALDPITFVPEDYQWSIVGSASSVDWPANNDCGAVGEDLDLNYSGFTAGTNTYTWTSNGAIALIPGQFKFRTNHCWTYNKGYTGFTSITGDGAADMSSSGPGDFNFVTSTTASYIIKIKTTDDGATWTIDFDKQ